MEKTTHLSSPPPLFSRLQFLSCEQTLRRHFCWFVTKSYFLPIKNLIQFPYLSLKRNCVDLWGTGKKTEDRETTQLLFSLVLNGTEAKDLGCNMNIFKYVCV